MNRVPSKAKPGNNSWFVTVPAVAASLAFWFFVYRPAQEDIRQMQAELELMQQALADAASLPDKLRRAREESAAASNFVDSWRQSVSRQNLPELFGKISEIVSVSGSKSTKFQPEPAVGYRSMERLPITLACQGSFQQVFQLLCKLEELPQSVWIDELHIQQSGKDEAAVNCDIKLEVFSGKSNLADSND